MGIKKLDDFNHDVEVTKEVLASMPKNNAKNLTLYKNKVKELKDEYGSYRDQLFNEIKVRSSKYLSIKPNARTEKVRNELKDYKDLGLYNPLNTSFEKMGFDILFYSLTHFYKNDLESVNNDIKEILSKFRMVGISLSDRDFIYSTYAKRYIRELLKDDDLERMKDVFEDIHWKCPNVILHVEVCFRILFNKNVKVFDKFLEDSKKDVLGAGLSYDDYLIKRNNLAQELTELENYDKAVLLTKFMNGDLMLNDYSKVNVDKCYARFLGDNVDISAVSSKLDDFKSLYYNLDEYRNYLKFSYVLEDIKVKYAECSSHVGETTKITKEINSLIDELAKMSNDIENGSTKSFLFFKKKIDTEQFLVQLDEKVKMLEEKFAEYDRAFVYEQMNKNLSTTSSVYDALNFAYAFKGYLRECIKEHEDGIDIKKIKSIIKEYESFMLNPNLTILKNIKFSSNDDLSLVVTDHYKMLNINIDKDQLTAEGIEDIIKSLNIIIINNSLENCELSINIILELFESKKLIEMYEKTIN